MARGSPTLETLAAFVAVFAVQQVLGLLLGSPLVLALAPPLDVRPWTLVTSVYAHDGLGHLLANAIGLLVAGLAVERGTTRLRYHAFFVTTGVASGAAHVLVTTGLLGRPSAVIGASGAVFALLGYVLTANRLSGAILDRFRASRRTKVVLLLGIAALVTMATGAPGVALVSHFTGLVLGLVAGRMRLLAVDRSRSASY